MKIGGLWTLCLVLMMGRAVADDPVASQPTGMWIDNFSVIGPVTGRYTPPWQDVPTAAGRYYSIKNGHKKQESLIRDYFTEGVIEVDTEAIEPAPVGMNFPNFGGTGLIIKSNDDEVVRLRVGPYEQIQLTGHVGGKPFEHAGTFFNLEFGRTYHLKAVLRGGRLQVWVDDQQYFDVDCGISSAPGRTGLYCESPCWFDNYQVSGTLPDPQRRRPLTGTPHLELVHSCFRAEPPAPNELLSTQGSIEIYLRNTGDGPAELSSIDLFGKPIDFSLRSGAVVWYEQRPHWIGPGEIGQVIVRLRGLPAGMGEQVMLDPAARPKFKLKLHWVGKVSREFEVPYRGLSQPFQINFLAFGQGLRTLYIYLQNNNRVDTGDRRKRRLDRVIVGGRDVTESTIFGDRVLGDRVVPLRVDLPEPLENGRHVSVLVTTEDGGHAGHSLRAIPSFTLMQVCVFCQWTGKELIIGPRADWIEDIALHCANAISVVGKYYQHLPRVKQQGLRAGGFGSFVAGYGGWGRGWDKPGNPEIVSCWMDEVDKGTPYELFTAYRAMKQEHRLNGKPVPFHSPNIMLSQNAGSNAFAEIADGVIHAYGIADNYGSAFGRYEGLEHREFRRSRRPFLPYFRNTEVYPHINPETMTVSKMDSPWLRCMSPEEERWQYFGCLLQGAKGVQHWGYSSIRDKSGYGGDSFRLGLGGAGTGQIWSYGIAPTIVKMLQEVWDEVGRCNAEWRAIEDLIAISDVSNHARVSASEPALNAAGQPAAAASSLVAGLDALVVVALNHHMDLRKLSDRRPSTFHPVETSIEVTIPPWLQPVDVVRVSHDGLSDVEYMLENGILRYTTKLHVSDLVVITGRLGMRDHISRQLAVMQRNLQKAYASEAVHTDEPSPYVAGENF